MRIYELNKTQFINQPIDVVFDFFSKPENLALITPLKLAFKILTPTLITINRGTLIDYTISLMRFPVHWRTLITKYNPPYEFVDEQIKGPYLFWHHTHTFNAVNGGSEIKDKVQYSIPMGYLGVILHRLWIKRDINHIFEHRKQIIKDMFSGDQYKKYIAPHTCGVAT